MFAYEIIKIKYKIEWNKQGERLLEKGDIVKPNDGGDQGFYLRKILCV